MRVESRAAVDDSLGVVVSECSERGRVISIQREIYKTKL